MSISLFSPTFSEPYKAGAYHRSVFSTSKRGPSKTYAYRAVFGVMALIIALCSQLALADSEEDEPTPTPTETTTECKKGKIWDADKQKCINIQSSSLSDSEIFQTARELAYSGRYHDAIRLLHLADNPQDPRILNYLGFSYRKAGDFDAALSYYQQALLVDPDYNLARSYMGQGYIADGREELAIEQLREIDQRGGKTTWAYRSLASAIVNNNSYAY